MVYVQQVEEEKLRDTEEFKNRRAKIGNKSGQQKRPAPSSASTPTPKNKREYNNQNFRAKIAYSQGSVAQGDSKPPTYTKCGRNHSGICREGSTGSLKYGQTGHFMRECPKNKQGNGNGGNRSQSSLVSPQDRAAPRRATFDTEQQDSPDVFTGMIQVFDFIVYALTDPGASLSFVTPYVAMNFDVIPEQLSEPFNVYTLVGESILAERVYCYCPISVNHKSTMVDLIELDMLHVCYASVDCRTRVVKFQFPNESVLEWKSSSAVPRGHSILYLKARKLVSKGCVYHLVRVNDSSVE
ncbi:hypothetical protein H5410_030585, partial [Solanum commersonii]